MDLSSNNTIYETPKPFLHTPLNPRKPAISKPNVFLPKYSNTRRVHSIFSIDTTPSRMLNAFGSIKPVNQVRSYSTSHSSHSSQYNVPLDLTLSGQTIETTHRFSRIGSTNCNPPNGVNPFGVLTGANSLNSGSDISGGSGASGINLANGVNGNGVSVNGGNGVSNTRKKEKVELPKIIRRGTPNKTRPGEVFNLGVPLLLDLTSINKRKKFCFKKVSQDSLLKVQGYLHAVQSPALADHKPIVIVIIEGIIADWEFYPLRKNLKGSLVLNTGFIGVLKTITAFYSVVLVSSWDIPKITKVLEALQSVDISATYKLVGRGLSQNEDAGGKDLRWCLNFSRILKDFKVPEKLVSKNVLFIIPLLSKVKDPEDLVGENLRMNFLRAPVPSFDFPVSPVILGIPHIGLRQKADLENLEEIVIKLQKNVFQSYWETSFTNTVKVKTSLLYWKLLFQNSAPSLRDAGKSLKSEINESFFSYFLILGKGREEIKLTVLEQYRATSLYNYSLCEDN